MRIALMIAFLCFFASDAGAQGCDICGCRGGSGWRHVKTDKCIGCDEIRRCGKNMVRCEFEGAQYVDRIPCLVRAAPPPPTRPEQPKAVKGPQGSQEVARVRPLK